MSEKQKRMDCKLDSICEDNKKEEIHIRGIEESVKSAHKRINEYEGRLREVENRCATCQTCNRKE